VDEKSWPANFGLEIEKTLIKYQFVVIFLMFFEKVQKCLQALARAVLIKSLFFSF